MNINTLENRLNDPDRQIRMEAVVDIKNSLSGGQLEAGSRQDNCNLHAHSFYSYNTHNFSPSALAWLARREGIGVMGIVDFDTLEGNDEFLWACDQLEVCGTVSLETRIYLPEFADRIITSKGQPGVAYYLLSGFTSDTSSPLVSETLSELQSYLSKRNHQIVQTLNDFLSPVQVSYEKDVISLSAGETPTERHIMAAYYLLGNKILDNPISFWSTRLGVESSKIKNDYTHPSSFRRLMREKLVKAEGMAFQTPDTSNFPELNLINRLADLTGTLPTLVWANGTSEGERQEQVLLEYLVERGLLGVNIVPERSIAVPESEKAARINCLCEIIDLTKQLDLPVFIGTEMNQPTHKWVDDLNHPSLVPFKDCFMQGAYLLHGHTMLTRNAHMGYRSSWANSQFIDRRTRNTFFSSVGALLPNTKPSRLFLQSLPAEVTAKDLLRLIHDKFSIS